MIGTLQTVLEVPNDQAWAKDIRFWVGRTRTNPPELTGGSVHLRQQGQCGGATFDMTVGNGRIQLIDNILAIRVSEADMLTLTPGTYDIQIRAEIGADTRQLRGVISVLAGLG